MFVIGMRLAQEYPFGLSGGPPGRVLGMSEHS